MGECELYKDCQKERLERSRFEGIVTTKLDTIDTGVKSVWKAIEIGREDIKKLYFKVGLISGGTSLIVSLVVSLIITVMKR
jgi:hypothetical protein